MDQSGSAKTQVAAPAKRSGWRETFSALQYRNFRFLWFTTILSAGGNWIQQVTLGWLAFDITESPLRVALVMGVRALPMLFAPLSGVMADRFNRRRILILDHIGLMLLALGFSLIILTDNLAEWHLYTFSFLTGVGWSINNPIRQALVGNSVPRDGLMNAVALNSMGFNSMRMIGPAIGGTLIVLFGPGLNFMLQAALYVGVLAALVPFHPDQGVRRDPRTSNSVLRDLGDGFAFIRDKPIILTAIALSLIPTFTMMAFIGTQMPVYAAVVLGDAEGGSLGLLFSAMGFGGFVGTVLVARFSQLEHKGRLVLGSAAGAGVLVLVLAQVEVLWLAMIVLAVQQVFFNTVMVTNNTILQAMTPDEMRGRVLGVLMVDIGFMPLGGVVAGVLADVYSVSISWMIGATVGLVVLSFVAVFAPQFRRLRL